MKAHHIAVAVWCCFLIGVGCSDKETSFSPVESAAVTDVMVAGETIITELALDNLARTRGLMSRTKLGDHEGMLFVFPDSEIRRFWMNDTLIGLDIIFLEDDGRIINVEEAPPGVEKPGFYSDQPCRVVLELRRGWCAERGVEAGDRVSFVGGLLERARL
ncbi:MAG: DUF192 domain-containing protein [Planctomycetota bacterium]|nr:DUF192 domain-containing protein [Planctomycetota bacterium]